MTLYSYVKGEDYNARRVFVSGSNGFVGRRLAAALANRGYSVMHYSRSDGKDILDTEELKRGMRGADYVFHLAADLDEESGFLRRVNVDGTRNVLEAAAKNRIKKFVFLSTTGVYGEYVGCADESAVKNPVTKYEKSKSDAEDIVLGYQEVLPVVIVRSALVLGCNAYWKQILRLVEKKFPLIGDGKNVFQTIFVDNLVNALVVVLEKSALGEVYLACDDEKPSLNDLHSKFAAALGVNSRPFHIPKFLAKLLVPFLGGGIVTAPHIDRLCRNRCYDNSKLKSIGYEQKVLLDAALKEIVAEYRKQ